MPTSGRRSSGSATARRPERWVCLIYHQVPLTPPSGPDAHFSITAADFARQLDCLLANGFTVESVEHAVRHGDGPVVALTFDDGHETHYSTAYPLLSERGLRATFFVVTDRVGTAGYVTWDQLREMKAAGMSIQSHTASHPFLSTLAVSEVRAELRDSKARLDAELGQATSTLALPGGDFPARTARTAIAEAGYALVATSRVGTNGYEPRPGRDVRFLPRVTVRQGQSPDHFERIIQQDPGTLRREWLRAGVLGAARSILGRPRYARWRRRFLDTLQ
jgi:peptidoglycan/xylan/chitin deacetylase (PgdA/CDA1 family)